LQSVINDYIVSYSEIPGADLKLCNNINIQRRIHKQLSIGISGIHGWGCFMMEGVEKGDYITEYIGEVISQEEAERRGTIYDKINCSYLFNLTSTQCLDATRAGNLAKFINHSNDPNCEPRVLKVGVDHKVGFYALKKINKGEEICFDYGYNSDSAPTWISINK
jgi:SET domain-containing protein